MFQRAHAEDAARADNAALAAEIDRANAVSLHPVTNRHHGICSPAYYRRAVDYIATRVSAPHLFVFADDQE